VPFHIRNLQSDNGAELPLAFSLIVQEAGIRYRYIKPRHPERNGKVERSHRTDQEESWSRHTFANLESAVPALAAWQHHYNYERFSLALQGQTPAEKLALRLRRPTPLNSLTTCIMDDGRSAGWGPHRSEIEHVYRE
jgi:transposase InsO family protein